LKQFRKKYYPPGTLILRDSSWKTVAGLLAALTLRTEEYKVDRMKKINTWLPKRKMIVIGDSTQSDPEAYGEMQVPAHFSMS
jgi:phosphatidate phosphatase APP1